MAAIPPFNHSGLIPPYVGTPQQAAAMSPYLATMSELVARFALTPERKAILSGLLDLRDAMRALGMVSGFQWIDGSFVEDCENLRKRPPGDVDVVTFAHRPLTHMDRAAFFQLTAANPDIFMPPLVKNRFSCDAYLVDLDSTPTAIVSRTRYFFGLFSHTRNGDTWKGLVQVPLQSDDAASRAQLV